LGGIRLGNRPVLGRDAGPDAREFNEAQIGQDRKICEILRRRVSEGPPEAENKIWDGHPVWFLDGNAVAGYNKLRDCVRLLFWSGQSFDEPGLVAQDNSRQRRLATFITAKSRGRSWADGSRRPVASRGTTRTS
jgi:hypothetical protein